MLLRATGGGGGGGAVTLEAAAGEGGVIGQIVYATITGTWKLAVANSIATTRAYGFLLSGMTTSFIGLAVNAGELVGSVAEWSAISGEVGGLTAGAQYFLSTSVTGNITKSPPTSGYRVPVGKAITTTRMAVSIEECIKLAS